MVEELSFTAMQAAKSQNVMPERPGVEQAAPSSPKNAMPPMTVTTAKAVRRFCAGAVYILQIGVP